MIRILILLALVASSHAAGFAAASSTIAGITSDGDTVTIDAHLIITTGHTEAVETITPLSGGNITIEEHADDGGSHFLVGNANGVLELNAPATRIDFDVANALKLAIYPTYVNPFVPVRISEYGTAPTGGAGATYIYADTADNDFYAVGPTVTTKLNDDAP